MSTNARKITGNANARKVVGSLAIIGTAAAVAGMGTFGTFTDSTTPVDTTIQSGTLSIDVTQTGYAVPVTTTGFVPGDSLTRAVTLVNDGSAQLSSINFASVATAGSVLTTDTVNGLQLSLKSCSVPWTQGGSAAAPTYACSGTTQTLSSGPAVTIPATTTGFVPGDSMTRAVNLINDGGSALGSVSLTAQVTSAATVLTTDAVNGLQLSVKGCSVAWTQGGTPTAPTYTCAGTERSVLNTAVANAGSAVPLTTPASLAAGGVDSLVFSISLPTTADNTFQGKSATLSLTFTGVQRAGTAR